MSVIDRLPDTRRAVWSEVEPGFHVANRGGEFIGYVDRADGVFVAFDGTSALLGRHQSLTHAQLAVIDAHSRPAHPVETPTRVRSRRWWAARRR